MSGIASQASKISNVVVTKTTGLTNQLVYWSKVGAEIGKIVYKKEGLAPPSKKEYTDVYNCVLSFIKSQQQQKEFIDKAIRFRPTKECGAKAGIYGIQLLAFYSVGNYVGEKIGDLIPVGK